MDFKDVFIDSLRYPFSDIKKLLTLFLYFLGSFILIPGIMANGYVLRIIEHTLKGSDELPDFNDKSELLGEGLKLIAANIIYSIPSYALIFYIMYLQSINYPLLISGMVLAIILVAVGFLINIFFVLGLTNMVYEKKFTAVFSFKRILELIKQIGWKKYLAYLVVFTIIVEVISVVVSLLNPLMTFMGSFTIFGTLIISFAFNTYLLSFASRFKGLIFPERIEEEMNGETQEVAHAD